MCNFCFFKHCIFKNCLDTYFKIVLFDYKCFCYLLRLNNIERKVRKLCKIIHSSSEPNLSYFSLLKNA